MAEQGKRRSIGGFIQVLVVPPPPPVSVAMAGEPYEVDTTPPGSPPDTEPGWEWTPPKPYVDEYGIWHTGFGTWKRPTTSEERRGADNDG